MMAPTITGLLTIPSIGSVDVRVALEDATMQDGAAVTIAETLIVAAEGETRFTLEVPDERLAVGRDYLLCARATAAGETILRAGTVIAYPWTPHDDRPQRIALIAFPTSKGA